MFLLLLLPLLFSFSSISFCIAFFDRRALFGILCVALFCIVCCPVKLFGYNYAYTVDSACREIEVIFFAQHVRSLLHPKDSKKEGNIFGY